MIDIDAKRDEPVANGILLCGPPSRVRLSQFHGVCLWFRGHNGDQLRRGREGWHGCRLPVGVEPVLMGAIGFLIPPARSVLVLCALFIRNLAAQITDQRYLDLQVLSRMRHRKGKPKRAKATSRITLPWRLTRNGTNSPTSRNDSRPAY
jgi:hypothetical protein